MPQFSSLNWMVIFVLSFSMVGVVFSVLWWYQPWKY